MKTKSLLQDWLSLHRAGVRARTAESYQSLLTSYVLPSIGEIDLDELTPADIRHMLAAIVATGHTRTAELVFVMLKCAFAEMDHPELMLRIKRPKHIQQRPTPWSLDQMRTYLAALEDHPHGLALSLGLLLGLRRGEICGLRWRDIDFDSAKLHICNQRVRLATGDIIDCKPKSDSGDRWLPLPPELLARLKAARQLHGYVDPITPSGLDHAHAALVRRLDLPPIPLHGLRHSMATAALREGCDMRILQSILGHASMSTTANIYTHTDLDMLIPALVNLTSLCYTRSTGKHLTLNQGVQGSSP